MNWPGGLLQTCFILGLCFQGPFNILANNSLFQGSLFYCYLSHLGYMVLLLCHVWPSFGITVTIDSFSPSLSSLRTNESGSASSWDSRFIVPASCAFTVSSVFVTPAVSLSTPPVAFRSSAIVLGSSLLCCLKEEFLNVWNHLFL